MSLLSDLLRFSLFGGVNPVEGLPVPPSLEEWESLYEESRRQAVTALTYDALLKLPKEQRPPRKVLFHFMSMTKTIEDDNRQRERALLRLAGMIRERLGKYAVVVKGSSLASHYTEPLHRECGDNDLYTGEDTEQVCRMLEERGEGVEIDRHSPRHASFEFDGVEFECHNYLFHAGSDIEWHSEPFALGDVTMARLPIEQEALFLAEHCEYHAVFFNAPVRLRTLVDWSLLLSSEGFDYSKLAELKRGTKLDCFVDMMTLYCSDLFGLETSCSVSSLSAKGLTVDDFRRLYMDCPDRHPLAVVRLVRRSWKYLRYNRKYRTIYGTSMFRLFYLKNIWVSIRDWVSAATPKHRKDRR